MTQFPSGCAIDHRAAALSLWELSATRWLPRGAPCCSTDRPSFSACVFPRCPCQCTELVL